MESYSSDTNLLILTENEVQRDPACDDVSEAGNFAASTTNYANPVFLDENEEGAESRRRHIWQMNYQEAAIYLKEGNNNDKFTTHPKSHYDLPAYIFAHHTLVHVVDLLASLLILGLAVIESPAVASLNAPIEVHASLEIFGILVLCLDLIFKARWQGPKTFFMHKRSVAKCLLLLVMLLEAVTVIARQTSHIRVTRALRPLFLLNTHYCRGIRRFCRQLLQSLPPILELLFLLLFVMLMFSILGFYLFSGIPNNPYFRTIQDSFISLFVLLSTANYPDVMMPAYAASPFAAAFFIIYISVELYFLMNIFLAVVYSNFTSLEKEKIKKLLLHQKMGCDYAFKLLLSKQSLNTISPQHFAGMMKFYQPFARKDEIYLMYKTLNASKTGSISLAEFYNIYSVTAVRWKVASKDDVWFERSDVGIKRIFMWIKWLIQLKWFEVVMHIVVFANLAIILYEAIADSLRHSSMLGYKILDSVTFLKASWYSVMFIVIYVLEILLKMLGLGPSGYFSNGWNVFDFSVTLMSIAGLFKDLIQDNFSLFIILRPFRVFGLVKVRKSYRDVLGTLFILADRLWSLVVTFLLLYYFYAVIGMECFSQFDMLDCCKNNTSISPYYANGSGFYYLNNFKDIFRTGLTLFELTVVNNWYVHMEGYAYVATDWSRLYFMTFYLVTMVVMTVVVAFVLEAFMFKIQYKKKMTQNPNIDYLVYEQTLSSAEIHMINNVRPSEWTARYITSPSDSQPTDVHFVGKKKRSKFQLSLQMYADEIVDWFNTSDRQNNKDVRTGNVGDGVPGQQNIVDS